MPRFGKPSVEVTQVARNWTNEQKQAIDARGGTLLVSAAAGSGKTAVLVERVISLITDDKKPCDANKLLVATFTNAAAAEMRERLSYRISELISQNPADRNLARQQILLQNSHISTIHSFCLDLIRENFEKLDISPDFRISDENEIKVLRQDVLTELLEEKYAAELNLAKTGRFLELAGMLGAGRDDKTLEDIVLRLYGFLRSLADPEDWLDKMLRMYNPGNSVGATLWGQAAIAYIKVALEGAKHILEDGLNIINNFELLQKAYLGAFSSDLRQIASACELAQAGDWASIYTAVNSIVFERLGSPRGFEEVQIKEDVKAKRDDVKDIIKKLLKGILSFSEEDFQSDLKQIYPLTECLFTLVTELDKRMFIKKQEKNILDFGDLEQLALRLLTEKTDNGLKPSAAAKSISARFDEVLVDEYQDTNPAQDAIFAAVSKGGRNLFMVGDVKQSIYRFRQASPGLFIDKKDRFSPFNEGVFPAKIILGRNFRSRRGITDAINFVFTQLMSRQFGEIEYDADEQLIPAAVFPEHDGADFALHIVDTSDYDENEDKYTLEARHIAGIIKKLMGEGYTVSGEDGSRKVTYRDFCILLRSSSGRAEGYARELTLSGIPVYTDMAGGYLGSYEVAVMLSLLRIIDNPLQDVALLSVMLSPIFGFSPEDMAKIRIKNRKGGLYLALVAYASELGGRFANFLEQLNNLRRLAGVLPADKLILRIFNETGFLNICQAMPSGNARRANLRLLLEYARNYEAAGYKGLDGFLRFIERIGEQKGDLAPASVVSEAANVVRIMSIHKSKGLEFPVCIIADLAKRFNKEDLTHNALFHPVYGFGPIVRDIKLNCRYTTLAREVVRMETEKSSLAEEMRVLYVAMTRAKEKLYCIMTMQNPEGVIKKAASIIREDETRLDAFRAAQAQSFAHWLLACSFRHPDCGLLRSTAGLSENCVIKNNSHWELVISKAISASYDEASFEENSETISLEGIDIIMTELQRRIDFVYPQGLLSKIPSKVAVSAIAEKSAATDFAYSPNRPMFLSSGTLTSAQAGTALHAFMQYAKLEKASTIANIELEINRLLNDKFLLKEEGAAINRQKVLRYINSEIFNRITNANKVWKEFRFNTSIAAVEIDSRAENFSETVVLQGMADIVFEENGEYFILDYKTDNATVEELRIRYTKQLEIYDRSVSEIMGKKVKEIYIYGFKEDILIKI